MSELCGMYDMGRLSLYQRVFHWLFGWDYASFQFGYGRYVRRAYCCANGHWFSRCYGAVIRDVDEDRQAYVLLTRKSKLQGVA